MKRSGLRKYSVTPYARAHRKAWKYFAAYIRQRDPWCYTCRHRITTEAGHFLHNRLDFDELNVHGQCDICNRHLHGNPDAYEMRLIAEFGEQSVDLLRYRGNQTQKYTIAELNDIAKAYKEKLK
jgi:hypothetical protein